MKFLTTAGLNFHLEELLKNAEQKVLLLTPYVKLHPKLHALLTSRKEQGVQVTFVCRKSDLKESLADCAHHVVDAPSLHAKCYLSERAAIVCSLNLHEFSQVNNDEMGVIVENSGADAELYLQVWKEVERLARPKWAIGKSLIKGKTYTHGELNSIFGFDFKGAAGIKKASTGALVLFNSIPAKNPESDGVVDFCGQNVDGPNKGLKFLDKELYECWKDPSREIHMFKEMTYQGRYKVVKEPEPNAKGEWRFPVSAL